MRHERSRTNVIATIGPASNSRDIIEQLIHEGIDVFRLNFSHGTQADHKKAIDTILLANKKLHSHVAILGDLQGPKLRVGMMKDGSVELLDGKIFSLVTFECEGTNEKAYISYPQLPMDVTPGEIILIDDGKIMLEVLESNKIDTVKTRIIAGGPLSSKKGVNLPNPEFKSNPYAQLSYIYTHSDYSELSYRRYPVYRVIN